MLLLLIGTAIAFDFTNGFHDTGNAMATSIATGALKPKTAVALAAVLNLVGAFLSVEVALTVTNAVIRIQDSSGAPKPEYVANHGHLLLMVVFCGLVGGVLWNLATWLLGLPSSSSHALFGGMIGAALAALGIQGVNWMGNGTKLDGVVGKVLLPAVASPVVAAIVATIGTWLVFKITAGIAARYQESGFRWGQIGTASLISLAHGTNDAQKTMGVITLGLIAYGTWTDTHSVPLWVKVACAIAIAAGTYVGGWRIIRTLGKGLVEISPPQGMSADASSAAIILTSSHLGFALSTTHVATGSILGTGLGRPGGTVRWRVALRMVLAWLITLPAAAVVGAVCYFIGNGIGGFPGVLIVFGLLVALTVLMWRHSRKVPVSAHNVNDDWDSAPVSPVSATEAASESPTEPPVATKA